LEKNIRFLLFSNDKFYIIEKQDDFFTSQKKNIKTTLTLRIIIPKHFGRIL